MQVYPKSHDSFKKPTLRVTSEMGHKFYVQLSRNVKEVKPEIVAQHIARLAFEHGIPQSSLSFYRKQDRKKVAKQPKTEFTQLSFDYIPF